MKFERYTLRFRQIGLRGTILGMLERFRNYVLYLIFNFDRWHVSATYHLRPYKAQVVSIVNKLRPHVVVEVGSGLGDILSHINAVTKYGIDMDDRAARAATLLHHKNCYFFQGKLDSLGNLNGYIREKAIDVLIMINWPHNVEFAKIQNAIRTLQDCKKLHYLVIDIISDQRSDYRYKHSLQNFMSIGEVIDCVQGSDGVRQILSIRLRED